MKNIHNNHYNRFHNPAFPNPHLGVSPPLPPYGGRPPLPFEGNPPLPPHLRMPLVRIVYDEASQNKLLSLFGELADYAAYILETCPPEVKLTAAICLGFTVKIDDTTNFSDSVRFASPFLTEAAAGLLAEGLRQNSCDAVRSVYDACPHEQTLLAIVAASLVKECMGKA